MLLFTARPNPCIYAHIHVCIYNAHNGLNTRFRQSLVAKLHVWLSVGFRHNLKRTKVWRDLTGIGKSLKSLKAQIYGFTSYRNQNRSFLRQSTDDDKSWRCDIVHTDIQRGGPDDTSRRWICHRTVGRWDRCCGRSWCSSDWEVGPCPGRCPAGPGTPEHSHPTSGIDRTHPPTSSLSVQHINNYRLQQKKNAPLKTCQNFTTYCRKKQ